MLSEITVRGKKYLEILNYIYQIQYDKDLLSKKIEPNFKEDEEERYDILSRVNGQLIPLLKQDHNTRQACFSILYPNGLGHCISTVHILLRNNTIILNEYYRSQNCSINLEYDKQTACMIVQEVLKHFPNYKSLITVFVASYHKEIK